MLLQSLLFHRWLEEEGEEEDNWLLLVEEPMVFLLRKRLHSMGKNSKKKKKNVVPLEKSKSLWLSWKNPSFFKVVHTSTNFEIYIPVACDLDVVAWVVPDFLGNA